MGSVKSKVNDVELRKTILDLFQTSNKIALDEEDFFDLMPLGTFENGGVWGTLERLEEEGIVKSREWAANRTCWTITSQDAKETE